MCKIALAQDARCRISNCTFAIESDCAFVTRVRNGIAPRSGPAAATAGLIRYGSSDVLLPETNAGFPRTSTAAPSRLASSLIRVQPCATKRCSSDRWRNGMESAAVTLIWLPDSRLSRLSATGRDAPLRPATWPGDVPTALGRPLSAAYLPVDASCGAAGPDPSPTSMRSDSSPESRQASYQAGSFCPHSQTLKRTVFAVRLCWWAT